MFALLRQAHDMCAGMVSLEMVDPMGSWNEGGWGDSPFNGEVRDGVQTYARTNRITKRKHKSHQTQT